jgi:glycerol kinase
LEATAYQTRDVLDAMEADSGVRILALMVDGGMTGNDLLMQFQADVLDLPVVRPRITETTVLGAAYAAGMAAGFWESLAELESHWEAGRTFEPAMAAEERDRLYSGWNKAVNKSLGWIVSDA